MDKVVVNPYGRNRVNLQGKVVLLDLKLWSVQQINQQKKTAKIIADFYKLKYETVSGWVKKVRSGGTLSEKGGRPAIFTPESLQNVKEKLENSVYDVRRTDYRIMMQEAAGKAAQQRGMFACMVNVSRNTLLKASKEIGVVNGHAEATTNARIAACGEIRNQVSMAAMIESQDCHQLFTLKF